MAQKRIVVREQPGGLLLRVLPTQGVMAKLFRGWWFLFSLVWTGGALAMAAVVGFNGAPGLGLAVAAMGLAFSLGLVGSLFLQLSTCELEVVGGYVEARQSLGSLSFTRGRFDAETLQIGAQRVFPYTNLDVDYEWFGSGIWEIFIHGGGRRVAIAYGLTRADCDSVIATLQGGPRERSSPPG